MTGSTVNTTATLLDLKGACSDRDNSPTVWYEVETDVDVIVNITTCSVGTVFDTVINIFVGHPESCDVTCLHRNDDNHLADSSQCSHPLHSHAAGVVLLAGLTYYIAVSGFDTDDAGPFELQLIPYDFSAFQSLDHTP